MEAAQLRRKTRKGTESCWECKRRKTRCTFNSSVDLICQGCRRRGTDCVSQQLPEQSAPAGSNRHIVDRLGHVEELVDHLVRAAADWPGSPRRRSSRGAVSQITSSVDPRQSPRGRGMSVRAEAESLARSTTSSAASQPIASIDAEPPGKHSDLCRRLRAAWPSDADLDVILSIPLQTSSILRAVTCTQSADPIGQGPPSPQDMLQLPPPGSHPVLVARKLLILGTYLQGLGPEFAQDLEGLSSSCSDIMSGVMATAHDLVTSKDDLVASTEGIECIILESLYENYAGSLRRAWLAARRAVTIAQILGLHRGIKPLSLSDASSRPDYMWFRLIQHDRYLCLMLGLPQSSSEDHFASPELLEPCIALERMQRLNCVAAGRILRRSSSDMYDLEVTKDIDSLIQYASASMEPQWWLTPNLASCNGHMERIHETLRFMDQFTHYSLLTQLHLPYLLRQSNERQGEYNEMAAIGASREALARTVSFRTFHRMGSYCPGVDLLTFISSTALCLAHIKDRCHRQNEQTAFPFLAHQRLSDRGMMEHTLSRMGPIPGRENDAVTTKVATLLQNLLAIEADAAAGAKYTINSSLGALDSEADEGFGCNVSLSGDGKTLGISIPYSWAIRVECVHSHTEAASWAPVHDPIISADYSRLPSRQESGGFDGWSESLHLQDSSLSRLVSPANDTNNVEPRIISMQDAQLFLPSQGASERGWGLQDTGMTFFDGHMGGISAVDTRDNI